MEYMYRSCLSKGCRCVKVLLAGLLLLACTAGHAQNVQVSGANASSNGSYATLKAAFDAINNFSQSGNTILVSVVDNTTETLTAALMQNSGPWTSLTITPSGARTIQGSIANELIDINGADNVTIDGLNTGGNSLTIDNTLSNASNGTIRLVNDAQNNTIANCTLKGSSTAPNAAVIFFSAADGSLNQGNDNNTVTGCVIRESSGGYPIFGINSFGSSGSPTTKWNSNNTVSNNEFVNIVSLSSGGNAAAIQLTNAANTDWTISGNSIYFDATMTSTAAANNYGVRITGANGQNFVINYNYIGGMAAGCAGSPMTWANDTRGNKFCGISVNTKNSGTATSIQGNTIANISLATNSSATSAPYIFCGIDVEGGLVNVGTTAGNIIGSSSATGSIVISVKSNPQGFVSGISSSGSATTSSISNNVIGGISISNPSASSTYVSFSGIYITGQTATISGNTVGSTTVAGSIVNATGSNSSTAFTTIGIASTSSTSVTVSGNTVSNLSYVGSGTSNIAEVKGISVTNGTNIVSGNSVSNLFNSNQNKQPGDSASVTGISCYGTSSGKQVYQNSISNLSNTNTGAAAVHVYGIYFNSSGTGHAIYENKIYDLGFASSNSSTSSGLDAIRIDQGTVSVYNNMIALGAGLTNNPFINGINIQGGVAAINFNTVYIEGTATGTATFTNALRFEGAGSGSTAEDNLLYNIRTSSNNANNSALYFASGNPGQVGNVTVCNYNNLYVGTVNTVLVAVNGTPYANLSAWTGAFGDDANSLSQSVLFVSTTGGNTGFLHLTLNSCATLLPGTPIAGITTDIDGETRSTLAPTMGADETGKCTWTGTLSSDWNTAGNWTGGVVPTKYSDVYIASGVPINPIITTTTAICHSLTINSGAMLSIQLNGKLTIDAYCSDGSFNNNGTFNAGTGTEEVAFISSSAAYNNSVSGTVGFNVVSTTTGLDFGAASTVSNTFRIDANGYALNNAPVYATGSYLLYNTGGYYDRSIEWNAASGKGYPYNVQLSNSSILNPARNDDTYDNRVFQCAGDLTIDAGAAIYMDYGGHNMKTALVVGNDININGSLSLAQSGLGGDVKVGGGWNRNGLTGNFYPNGSAVFFDGASDQYITVTNGGGTETFNYLIIDKSGGDVYLANSPATDINVEIVGYVGVPYNYLVLSGGDINLNGQTFYWSAPSTMLGAQTAAYIQVENAARMITGTGTMRVSGTLYNTSFQVQSVGGGSLIFDDDVTLIDSNGEINFGTGNLTTIRGVFQIENGGAAVANAAHYETGSILRFQNGNDYNVSSTDRTWQGGTSGDIGIPYHLEIINGAAATNVIMDPANTDDHKIRGNLTITNSTLQLSTGSAGNLYVDGDWTRTNGSFSANAKRVIFEGTALQTMTITPGYESFYDVTMDNLSGLTLAGTSVMRIADNLTLTNGLINTGGNEVYVTNTAGAAITGQPSNGSATSWINGYLRRAVATGAYDFQVGTATLSAAAGYELLSIDFSTNSNIDNLLVSFTTDGSTQNEPYNVVVNGTSVTDRLNAGWWTIQPYDATLTLVSAPSCNYNIDLNERGHTNSQADPEQYTVIKRDASYCYDACATAWTQCGVHLNATQTEIGGTAHAERSGYNCNSFSDWAIGFAPVILPIELTTFDATADGDQALLSWLTSSEYNAGYFGVERSVDGINFQQIGTVQAAGYSITPLNYSFVDYGINEIGASVIYYRLRLVDKDGSFKYSEVRLINLQAFSGNDVISVYPNPFGTEINIMWNASSDADATVSLMDVTGRELISRSYTVTQGANVIVLNDLWKVANGAYFLRILSGKHELTVKVIKER